MSASHLACIHGHFGWVTDVKLAVVESGDRYMLHSRLPPLFLPALARGEPQASVDTIPVQRCETAQSDILPVARYARGLLMYQRQRTSM